MWRSFFLAVGIFACLLGMECMVVDRAVLRQKGRPSEGGFTFASSPTPREVAPPEWAPWSLMSVGAVTILYAFTLPKRAGAKE